MTDSDLVNLAALGPVLVDATGKSAWAQPTAELVAGGKSNLTFLLHCAAGDLVLRRPPSGNVLPTAHDMGREVRVQRALADTNIPVPRIVYFDEEGTTLGYRGYVMSRVQGHIIRDRMPEGYATEPADRHRLGLALVRTLADLHQVDYQEVGLADHGRPDGFMARQIGRWGKQWDASREQTVEAVEELRSLLSSDVPQQQRATIVHGDFRIDNVVMDPNDPGTVAAVLDWEMSTLGDPLSDLGMFLFYWVDPGEAQSALTPSVTDQPGFPTRAELRAEYARHSGLDLSELSFYEAFSCFKAAVIAQGIDARVKAGVMGGQDFGDLSAAVRLCAERGLAALHDPSPDQES